MYLKKIFRLRHTLAFQLTLLYGGLFAISSFAAFVILYYLAASDIQKRLDHHLMSEIPEYTSFLSIKGLETLKTVLALEAESEGTNRIFFRIVNRNGDRLFSSNMSSWGDLGIGRTALDQLRNGSSHVFETVAIPENRNSVRIIYGVIGPDKILQIGQSLEGKKRLLGVFRKIFGTTIALLIALGALIGWFMARRTIAGVEEVTQTAMDISKGNFERRVSVKSRSEEISRLAWTFNVMLNRIDVLVTGLREMADTMAHDLRSPISRIRGMAEMTLTTGKFKDDYEATVTNIIEECDRLLEIANTTLDISEAETGASKLAVEKTDMARIVSDACELYQPTAEDKGVELISRISENSFVWGDVQRLQRMVVNLLDNALKYTPSGGTVTAAVHAAEEKVVISINDTGIGIDQDDLPNIFNRFYRCDRSRSQTGIGLGLSLAKAIVKAHDGDITATSYPGKGSQFIITLPYSALSP